MIKCDMKPVLLLVLFSCTCITSQEDTDYFIETPANITVTSPMLWGDFTCATRLGSRPLWIVNGVSIAIITERAGYNDTYTELFALPQQGDGSFLSFLSIPASPATNNSVVTCAATSTSSSSSRTILDYSTPVHMLVFLDAPGSENRTLTTPSLSSAPPSTSASLPGMDPTTDLMDTSHRDDRHTKLIKIASISVVCGLIFVFTISLMFVIVLVVLRRNRNFKKIKHMSKGSNHTVQSNIYWNPKEESTPNVVNMNYDKQYLNEH